MHGPTPARHRRIDDTIAGLRAGLRERVLNSGTLQTTVARAVPLVWGALLLISPVFAQSGEETGIQLCQSAPYNFFVGIGWAVIGFSTLAVGVAIFSGGAAKAFGFISNRISKAGNAALVGGLAAFGLIALVLVAAGIAFGTVPVSPPTECVVFF